MMSPIQAFEGELNVILKPAQGNAAVVPPHPVAIAQLLSMTIFLPRLRDSKPDQLPIVPLEG